MMTDQSVNRTGTVLIMCVGVIVLMVSIATAYIKAISPQRGAGYQQTINVIAKRAASSGQAHAISVLHQDYNAMLGGYSSDKSAWRQAFLALEDTDNLPVHAWEKDDGTGRVGNPSIEVNVDSNRGRLAKMIQVWAPDAVPTYSGSGLKGLLNAEDDDLSNPVARWYNIDYLDKSLMSILEQSPTENDALQNAQYIMRYAVEILDLNGHMRINPDYPNYPNQSGDHNYNAAQASFPISYDATSLSSPDHNYLKYLSYINRYARSIKSMHATREARTYNIHPFHKGFDPFDLERTDLRLDGSEALNTKNHAPEGHRASSDALFRGAGFSWSIYSGNREQRRMLSHTGKVFNYATLSAYYRVGGTPGIGYNSPVEGQLLNPFGHGLRDQDWDEFDSSSIHNGSNANNPNVPWHINLLTAPIRVREMMMLGLSSHLMFAIKGDYPDGEPNINLVNNAPSSATDLFGEHYPEAFPLGLDDGRDVRYIGEQEVRPASAGLIRKVDGFMLGGTQHPSGYPLVSNRLSYWFDVISALGQATESAYYAWNRGWDPRTVDKEGILDAASLIDPNENDPTRMLSLVEADFLRIVGEDLHAPNSGLLAGNQATTGYGPQKHISELDVGTNHRAMEYLLNDIRMSFFGSEALDFNDDSTAESTYAGWMHESGTRVWSWWWDGIQTVNDPNNSWANDPNYAWLLQATWYRMWHGDSLNGSGGGIANRIARYNGEEWIEYMSGDTEFDMLLEINRPFLQNTGNVAWSINSTPPIKPWSATGRLYIGPSTLFRVLVRGQVFDNITAEYVGEDHIDFTYTLDPSSTGSMDRARILHKRQHIYKYLE